MKNQQVGLTRRNFLKQVSAAAVVLPSFAFGISALAGCNKESTLAAGESNSSPLSWKTDIVTTKEPGEPLIITGTIFGLDGKTPLEAATLSIYHTDITGKYSPNSGNGGDNRTTRLRGKMLTGTDGRYEFRTIKPASYPDSTIAAHIHAYVSAPGFTEYWIDNFEFQGDPFIAAETQKNALSKGRLASILTLTRGSDGVLRGARDIQIERCSSDCLRS
jgi:protocatechuate 3,4-dioxygenase, beta subunit